MGKAPPVGRGGPPGQSVVHTIDRQTRVSRRRQRASWLCRIGCTVRVCVYRRYASTSPWSEYGGPGSTAQKVMDAWVSDTVGGMDTDGWDGINVRQTVGSGVVDDWIDAGCE